MELDTKQKKSPTVPTPLTFEARVSIVIPMRNEADNIGRCVESLMQQNYPSHLLEILVVDGMSTDGSQQIVHRLEEKYPQVRLLNNPHLLVQNGLNIGARNATGDVVIILGAHTKVEDDFIQLNISYLRDKGVMCVGGTQINVGDTFLQQTIGYAMSSPFGIATAPYRFMKKEQYVDTVVYAAYRRQLFDQVGYFETDLFISEDAEFNWRIRKAGHKILFTPRIFTYYYPRKRLDTLFKQFFKYGRARVAVVKKHYDALKALHLVPSCFVMSLVLLIVFSLWYPEARWILGGLGIAYFLGSYIAAIPVGLLHGWKHAVVLPLPFIAMHIGFGLGFMVGAVKTYK